MAAGGDQPKQMLDWIKRVQKVGYLVEQDKLLYKIRNPDTNALIITAPRFPRGNQVLRDTLNRAKKNGIDVDRMEIELRERKMRQPKTAPPPAVSELPPEMAERARQHEEAMRARQEEQVTETATRPKKKGRGPTTPAKIAATAEAAKLVKRALNTMGGDTPDNRRKLFKFGKERAIKTGRRYPSDSAKKETEASWAHMHKLLGGAPGGMHGWVDEFWTITARAVIAEDPWGDAPAATTEPTAAEREAESIVEEVFAGAGDDTPGTDDSAEEMFALRESLAAVTEDLADERAAHESTIQRFGKDLAKERELVAQLEGELARARAALTDKVTNGGGGADIFSDDLARQVFTRMLARNLKSDEGIVAAVVEKAVEFAEEVIDRTSA